ncbi:S-methyl-5-thioribose-1-phosphate isomerase [Rhodothermus profundi]|uniref:Methylthioribose-1-phosphate isomerase n=1 Tax=Rhodothermus profundi TaxID=633813 RepID=A0A1M6PZ94_9BACT|nr:S-methyl-5-thioribose-1-phosphate isomerase [Rhodothermus profundi]SHK13186.1 methylthioribose-1-phosphate isomerase [Rhodothermus profundi]
MIPPLQWNDEAFRVDLLDQTRLPVEERWIPIETPEQMAEAIRKLRVRGAPAIGIAAAYGVVLALRDPGAGPDAVQQALEQLRQTRPTAVNLFGALQRMEAVLKAYWQADRETLKAQLLAEARAIEAEDREAGRRLGAYGLELLKDGMRVLTHCHTGGVATSGYGTALAPFILGKERGVRLEAWVDETRPLLQGSRITAWELLKAGVPATLITDSMAAHVMQQGWVDAVIVGADRIAANGDVANKIGTYGLAVLARAHNIPFYVSAPVSTIDFETPSGQAIVIEERDPREITHGFGRQTAPDGIRVYNPAFDVTPAALITAIITDRGILRPPYPEALAALRAQLEAEISTPSTT